MFSIAKVLIVSTFVGLVTCLLVIGGIGLWTGVPLAFLEVLPGDDSAELRQLPRDLLLAGFGGFSVGWLGGLASQLTRQRINYLVSTLLIGVCVMLTISWTHPGLNVNIDSGWLDYLESYRLTVLTALGATAGVIVLGMALRPFKGGKVQE